VRIELNPIDSEVVGRAVLEITDVSDPAALADAERAAVARHAPLLAVCKVRAEDTPLLHAVEDLGFRFAECQLQLRGRLLQGVDVSGYLEDYEYLRVERERDLDAVLALAGEIFENDRFSRDPRLGAALAGRRYQAYVRRSFAASDESVHAMRDRATGEVLAFTTHRRVSPREVRLLVGGVSRSHRRMGLAMASDQLEFAAHYRDGVRVLHSAVSSMNYPTLVGLCSYHRFHVVQSWVVLHKHYGSAT